MALLAPLIFIFLVFPLYLVEIFLPYPYFVEELAKFFVVYFAISRQKKARKRLEVALVSGFLFSLSETLLYFATASMMGGINIIITRFILTSLIHCLTISLMTISLNKKNLIFLALLLSIGIHYFFNLMIMKF